MGKFAANTTVSVEKSEMEIKATVRRYGADGFASGWQGNRASIQFTMAGRRIRFIMTLPDRNDEKFTDYLRRHTPHRRTQSASDDLWDRACRQKWRALALLVKAKLEAVDANISTIEEAFFADIVMPDGRTVYENARQQVALAYEQHTNLPLLLGN